jgi:hypothetical protein
MLDHVRPAASALAAGLVLLIAASVANAEPLRVEPTRVRAVWSTLTFSTSASTVRCPVTLEGSFHSSTFEPREGLQVGYITRASVAEASCTGGRVRLLSETLPWRIQYESALGTLPEISGIRLKVVGLAARGEVSGLNCLYQSSESRPARATLEIRPQYVEVTGLRLDESAAIPLITREGLCAFGGDARASGTARVTASDSSGGVDVAFIGSSAPLTSNPAAPIRIRLERTTVDVELEATSSVNTGPRLEMIGNFGGRFRVSEGCNNRTIGRDPALHACTMTITYDQGLGRPLLAYVWIPFNGLARTMLVIAETTN